MKKILTLSAVVFLGLIHGANATKFGVPKDDQEVKSPNGQYLLHIDAKSGLHEVREGTKLLWSFEKDLFFEQYFVSNDGKYVLWLPWAAVKADEVGKEALIVYSSGGVALKKTFAELGTPRPYKKDEIGPIGDFWRIWRGDATRRGEVISIVVEGREKPFEIDFSKIEELRKADQEGGGQPATAPIPEPEGREKPKSESAALATEHPIIFYLVTQADVIAVARVRDPQIWVASDSIVVTGQSTALVERTLKGEKLPSTIKFGVIRHLDNVSVVSKHPPQPSPKGGLEIPVNPAIPRKSTTVDDTDSLKSEDKVIVFLRRGKDGSLNAIDDFLHTLPYSLELEGKVSAAAKNQAHQDGSGQPDTRPESK